MKVTFFLVGIFLYGLIISDSYAQKKKAWHVAEKKDSARPSTPLTPEEIARRAEIDRQNAVANLRWEEIAKKAEENRRAAETSPIQCPATLNISGRILTGPRKDYHQGKVDCHYAKSNPLMKIVECSNTSGKVLGYDFCKMGENNNFRIYLNLSEKLTKSTCPTTYRGAEHFYSDNIDDEFKEINGFPLLECHYAPAVGAVLDRNWCASNSGKIITPEFCDFQIDELKRARVLLSSSNCPRKFYSTTDNFVKINRMPHGGIECHYSTPVSIQQCENISVDKKLEFESHTVSKNHDDFSGECRLNDGNGKVFILPIPNSHHSTNEYGETVEVTYRRLDKINCPTSFATLGHTPEKQLRSADPFVVACVYQGTIRPEQCPEADDFFLPHGWIQGVWCNFDKDRYTPGLYTRLIQIIRTNPRGESNGSRDINGKPRPSAAPRSGGTTATTE